MKTSLMEKNDILKWSLSSMKDVLNQYMKELEDDALVHLAFESVSHFLDGHLTVHEGRAIALKMHERARTESSPSVIFFFRALGQMVSVIHVKTHAMGHLYYTLKMLLALQLDLTDTYLKEALEKLDHMQKERCL
jgi:hypothetical protein